MKYACVCYVNYRCQCTSDELFDNFWQQISVLQEFFVDTPVPATSSNSQLNMDNPFGELSRFRELT